MIEGKIANRTEVRGESQGEVSCEKCSRKVKAPSNATMLSNEILLNLKSYVGMSYFVYESQSGQAICYCSQKCAKKHNHRFR